MPTKTLRAVLFSAIGFLGVAGAAQADPMFPSLALAPLSAAELADLDRGYAPRDTDGFGSAVAAAFPQINDDDIVEAPVATASDEWRDAPRARPGIAEMRERFETGDTPQFLLTRFTTE